MFGLFNDINPPEPVEPEQPKRYFRAEFYLKTAHTEFCWACNKTHDDIQMHFIEFVKWYHCRESSESFVLRYSSGVTCFRKCDVLYYTMTAIEETEEEYNKRNGKG